MNDHQLEQAKTCMDRRPELTAGSGTGTRNGPSYLYGIVNTTELGPGSTRDRAKHGTAAGDHTEGRHLIFGRRRRRRGRNFRHLPKTLANKGGYSHCNFQVSTGAIHRSSTKITYRASYCRQSQREGCRHPWNITSSFPSSVSRSRLHHHRLSWEHAR